MSKILSFIVIALFSFSAMAEHHESKDADLHAAIKAFDYAYANNDVDAYHEEWTALMEAAPGRDPT